MFPTDIVNFVKKYPAYAINVEKPQNPGDTWLVTGGPDSGFLPDDDMQLQLDGGLSEEVVWTILEAVRIAYENGQMDALQLRLPLVDRQEPPRRARKSTSPKPGLAGFGLPAPGGGAGNGPTC